MQSHVHDLLERAAARDTLPRVVAYNRIDGPGSSLDLREFQQTLWTRPAMPRSLAADPEQTWTRNLPRTVGITIDTGTQVEAQPMEPSMIGVQSVEYGTEVAAKPGEVLPIKENWLLKILEVFGLSGVKFVLHNIRPGTKSAGLGGSATATTGVCILANELVGRPFSRTQIIAMASRIEQDYGVSFTGTQEQSNVVFGGVTDYVWFPWGIPGREESGYGHSIRTELIPPERYDDLQRRMLLLHCGITRASADVNSVWISALSTPEGYELHRRKPEMAYQFREGLRLGKWSQVLRTIRDYQKIRTQLCADYMNGSREIQGFADARGCAAFPLGAGGGGGVLVFGSDPDSVAQLRRELSGAYREIPFRIREVGHDLINLPFREGLGEWK